MLVRLFDGIDLGVFARDDVSAKCGVLLAVEHVLGFFPCAAVGHALFFGHVVNEFGDHAELHPSGFLVGREFGGSLVAVLAVFASGQTVGACLFGAVGFGVSFEQDVSDSAGDVLKSWV